MIRSKGIGEPAMAKKLGKSKTTQSQVTEASDRVAENLDVDVLLCNCPMNRGIEMNLTVKQKIDSKTGMRNLLRRQEQMLRAGRDRIRPKQSRSQRPLTHSIDRPSSTRDH
jgi:hypothetical protein